MTTTDAHDDALSWLVGQLRWERRLTDLRAEADHTNEPVALVAADVRRAA
jgi:hypothetical protein